MYLQAKKYQADNAGNKKKKVNRFKMYSTINFCFLGFKFYENFSSPQMRAKFFILCKNNNFTCFSDTQFLGKQ